MCFGSDLKRPVLVSYSLSFVIFKDYAFICRESWMYNGLGWCILPLLEYTHGFIATMMMMMIQDCVRKQTLFCICCKCSSHFMLSLKQFSST